MFDRILDQYRRYYWAANGFLVLAIAYVLAGMIVRSAIDRFVPMPEPRATVAPVVVKDQRPATIADYQVILSRNLLNAKIEEAPPPPVPGTENGQPAKSTIQATLMGTVAGSPRYAFAIVQSGGKTEVVRIGEKIAGQAEVLEIRRGAITIMNNGRKEELTMYDEKALPGNAPPPPPPMANSMAMSDPMNPSGMPDVAVVENAPGNFTIDKTEFEAMTTNLGPLLTQARVVPNFQNGVINGYKIFAIKPESLYMKIGMENGDIIHSINGIKIDSPEKALQLFQSLRTEKSFNIDLSRNNEPLTFNYNLR